LAEVQVGNNDQPSGHEYLRPATSEIVWDKIENSIGYGRADAPVMFIGMEEGASKDPEADLVTRFSYENRARLEAGARYQPTWDKMSDLMLRLTGVEPTPAAKLRAFEEVA
jgi:hypothetical protein